MMLTAETHLRVSPKGVVNFLCGICDYRVAPEQADIIQHWGTVVCRNPNCRASVQIDNNLALDIRADHGHLIATTPKVWYHVTTRKAWSETPKTLYVHVGTPQTVAWYANVSFEAERDLGHTLSFWRVELSDEAQANTETTIYRDDNDWPDFYSKSWGDPLWPVKYVNRFELPGSISLLTEFKHLASVERIPDETAKGMFRYDPKKEFSE